MSKFRIVYHVVEPIRARTEEAALKHLEGISDDLDEFATEACSGKIVAVLERWEPCDISEHPEGGYWEQVKRV